MRQQAHNIYSFDDIFYHQGFKIREFNKNNVQHQSLADTFSHEKLFNIENRRYIGSKSKLMAWINNILLTECLDCHSFFDVFAGTGIVSQSMLAHYNKLIMNDFLFSNHVIYHGFLSQQPFNFNKLILLKNNFNQASDISKENYFSDNFGDKFFSLNDAKKIGWIREEIEQLFLANKINQKEYYILLTSLIYSLDRVSNTVGHYEAYIKGKTIANRFVFDLIQPIISDKDIQIYREDANVLAPNIDADIAFIDPPYNSRQYSRFYHVLETLIKWDKPELFGIAMKPKEENMSNYCRSSAPQAFDDLIQNLNTKYIAVTYNNTYTSKSSSSQNKISLAQITEILQRKGQTKVFETSHQFFNTGKTDFNDHKEFLFITQVG